MSRPSVLYPYEIDKDGSIQTIHREIAECLQEHYSFTGFVRNNVELVDGTFDKCVIIDGRSKPVKAVRYAQEYFKKYDLIHTGQPHHFKRHRRFTQFAAARGAQVVHTLHTPWYEEPEKAAYQRRAVQHADIVTAVYPYVLNWAEQTLDHDDIRLVPNGVDLELFNPHVAQTDPQRALFVGWLKEEKHPEFIPPLARELPEMTFDMVGWGPLESKVRSSMPENVIIHGHQSKPELAKLYARASVLLCPFDVHGAGMVALEAAACGTPSVAIDTGASPFNVSDDSGVLLDELNVGEWAVTVERIRETDQFTPRAAVRQFSWENIAAQYGDLYTELLK